MHRNLGVFVAREVALKQLFAQFQGKPEGFTKGRDRSFHFGSQEHHIVGMISHLGAQLGLACGLALREQQLGSGKCVVAFTGDGATSQGDFHEALNVAAVWSLPVVFIVERNYWGLSTPEEEQFKFKSFVDKGPAYGMEARSFDGNNLAECYTELTKATDFSRTQSKPILLEANTFRIRGHEEASGTKYYPEGMIDTAMSDEPMAKILREPDHYGMDEKSLKLEMEKAKVRVDEAFHAALALDGPSYDAEESARDLFAEVPALPESASDSSREMRLIDALHDGLKESLALWPELIYMGQDIGPYGGVFKATEGLAERFGSNRVRNTPLCESAIVGTSLGWSIAGGKAMMEMQFSDFVTTGFNQIVNNLAKLHWRWGQAVDVVIRMPTGAGVAAGPFHSQSTEAWFTHVPGLKVVYPAFPAEAKALLMSSFNEPNPVLFFEHKAMYRTVREEVKEGAQFMELGKADVLRSGTDITVVTYGMGVHWTLDLIDEESLTDQLELINLRTLVPLDFNAIRSSVNRTGKVIVLQEDIAVGGYAEHIASRIAEECWEALDGPVITVSSDATPVPFHATLEEGFLAKSKLKEAVQKLLSY
jgi:2-oxoisovalerate dehydrogenase E1 component